MARESLADVIKRDFGGSNPSVVESPRTSGGIADLAGDDLVVSRALRQFEGARERASRQRAELDRATAPKVSPLDVSRLTQVERDKLVSEVFAADAEEAVEGYFALSPAERAAVIPDMDEDELEDYLERPTHSFGWDEEGSYEEVEEDDSDWEETT